MPGADYKTHALLHQLLGYCLSSPSLPFPTLLCEAGAGTLQTMFLLCLLAVCWVLVLGVSRGSSQQWKKKKGFAPFCLFLLGLPFCLGFLKASCRQNFPTLQCFLVAAAESSWKFAQRLKNQPHHAPPRRCQHQLAGAPCVLGFSSTGLTSEFLRVNNSNFFPLYSPA